MVTFSFSSAILHSYRGYRWHRWYREYCVYLQPTPSMTPIPLYTYRQPMPKSCKEVSAGLQMQDSSSKELELCSQGCMTMEKKDWSTESIEHVPKMEVACAQSHHMVMCKLNFAPIFISIVALLSLLLPLCCPLALPSVQHFSKSLLFLFFQTT